MFPCLRYCFAFLRTSYCFKSTLPVLPCSTAPDSDDPAVFKSLHKSHPLCTATAQTIHQSLYFFYFLSWVTLNWCVQLVHFLPLSAAKFSISQIRWKELFVNIKSFSLCFLCLILGFVVLGIVKTCLKPIWFVSDADLSIFVCINLMGGDAGGLSEVVVWGDFLGVCICFLWCIQEMEVDSSPGIVLKVQCMVPINWNAFRSMG